MKRNSLPSPRNDSLEILVEFGSAHLVRVASGHLELRGGSPLERAEAREWASLFLDTEYVVWHTAAA